MVPVIETAVRLRLFFPVKSCFKSDAEVSMNATTGGYRTGIFGFTSLAMFQVCFDLCPAPQDFTLVKSLGEASGVITAVTWSGGLLAAGGLDTKVRIYDSSQDLIFDARVWVVVAIRCDVEA